MRWLSLLQLIGSCLLCVALVNNGQNPKKQNEKTAQEDAISKLDVWKKLKELKARGELEDGDEENFYEFVNKITHGEMFNMSWEAHKMLEVCKGNAYT